MRILFRLRGIWRNAQGQDLIEYALMAGFVTSAAATFMPSISATISTIFSKITSTMSLVP